VIHQGAPQSSSTHWPSTSSANTAPDRGGQPEAEKGGIAASTEADPPRASRPRTAIAEAPAPQAPSKRPLPGRCRFTHPSRPQWPRANQHFGPRPAGRGTQPAEQNHQRPRRFSGKKPTLSTIIRAKHQGSQAPVTAETGPEPLTTTEGPGGPGRAHGTASERPKRALRSSPRPVLEFLALRSRPRRTATSALLGAPAQARSIPAKRRRRDGFHAEGHGPGGYVAIGAEADSLPGCLNVITKLRIRGKCRAAVGGLGAIGKPLGKIGRKTVWFMALQCQRTEVIAERYRGARAGGPFRGTRYRSTDSEERFAELIPAIPLPCADPRDAGLGFFQPADASARASVEQGHSGAAGWSPSCIRGHGFSWTAVKTPVITSPVTAGTTPAQRIGRARVLLSIGKSDSGDGPAGAVATAQHDLQRAIGLLTPADPPEPPALGPSSGSGVLVECR